METIGKIILCFTVSCLVSGIVVILAPEGSAGRALKAAAFVFVLAGIVSPLSECFGSSVRFTERNLIEKAFAPELASLSTEEIKRIAEAELREEIEAVLAAAGAENTGVSLTVSANSQYGVTVTGVRLILEEKDAEKKEEIAETAENLLGIMPEVEVKNE